MSMNLSCFGRIINKWHWQMAGMILPVCAMSLVFGMSHTSAAPLVPAIATVQVPTAIARETVELLIRKFGKEAVGEGGEGLAKQVDQISARLGDDGLEAIRKAGPKAISLLDEAGESGPQVARLLAKYGDEASWVVTSPSRMGLVARYGDEATEAMIKLGEPAEKIIDVGGASAAKAVSQLSNRHGRQLAMLADDTADAALVRNSALMDTISKYGDRGMEFVWKNKGALSVGAVLAALIADPEPFINGSKSLAEVAANAAVAPIATGVGRGTNWTIVILGVAAMAFVWFGFKRWLIQPQTPKASRR